MRKNLFFLSFLLIAALGWGQTLIISEVADPGDNYEARFVELYNATDSDIDLSAGNWYLSRQANGDTWGDIELTGIVPSGGTYIIAYNSSEFNFAYGFDPDQVSGNISGNGDDGYFLYSGGDHNSGTLVDAYGVIDEDGTGKAWEYTDSHAVRNSSVCSGNSTWTSSEWTITSANVADMTPGVHNCDCPSVSPAITLSTNSLTGFTYIEGNGPSGEQSFTVEGSNLTGDITVTPPANWEIATTSGGPYQTSAITLAQSGGTVGTTTIYTRMVAGLSQGTYTGNIVCSTDDGSGGTLTENVAVDGSVTYSNASDIIANTGFSYTVNIPYVDYQADPITNTTHSVGVFKFDIRDGGGSADSDALGTELTAITFSVGSAHGGYIRSAALFDGNTHLADGTVNSGTGEISFSGLSGADFTAPDNGTKSLTLRVSFTTNVTDNEQLQFTVISATADNNGSVFAEADAGGAQSAVTGDKNRIEVVADRLIFGQQPTTTIVNEVMSPAVTVKGVDVYQNLDLDFAGDVSITSLGTMTGDPITVTAVNGVATFDNIVHTVAGTDLYLKASCSGFTAVDSDTFDIVDFIYEAGDFRPKWDTDFSYNGDWEYYDGSSWGNVPDGKAPQNTRATINRIIINKNVTGGRSSRHSYDCDIIIFNNGKLTLTDDATTPSAEFITGDHKLEVLNGGKLVIQGDIDLASTVDFILRNGAYMLIDQNSMVNNHPMWDGDELFEGGSTVEIRDWDWSASPSVRSLINVITTISDNANGYKFGKIYFNPTNLTDTWTIVGGGVNVKVTENDFQINNPSSNYVAVMSNRTAGISAEFGGDLVIDDGPFTFGSSYSNDDFDQTIIVKGDLLVGTDDDIYLHKTFNGTPTIAEGDGQIKIHGNVEIWQLGSNVLTSDVDTKQILLTGDNDHTIFIERNCENMPLIIEGGDSAELVDSDLKFAGNSSITIQSNATFNFGFDGSTALEVQNVSGSGNKFIQESGAYLYITHPQGIWDASSNGNVQNFAASNTTYTQTNSTYHYIGKENQETGDAFTSGSTSKTIICELENNTDELTVTATTGTSSALEIRSGIVVNTESAHIYGSGDLTISNGGLRTSVLGTTGDVPLLSGTFNITGGFLELNAAGDQSLKGSRDYKDLIFSNAGTKTITSAIQNIDGTITIKDDAILDVESNQMGGAGTDLTMTDNAIFKIDGTSGTGVKPDAQGTYSLGAGTKIIFQNNGSTLQRIRLFRDYYNIDIEGANVGTEATSTPLRIQSGGTFRVLNGGKFSFINTAGFNGGTQTAIDSTNNPTITLEPGSTVEYAGDNQTLTDFSPGYRNLKISGSGIKTVFDNGNAGTYSVVTIKEDLDVAASTLQIDDFRSVIVDGDITNNGQITVQNQGSLVQTAVNPGISAGNYTLNKIATGLSHYYDYVFWSSPLNDNNFAFQDLVPNAWAYYRFDPSLQDPSQNPDPGWVPVSPADAFASGTGYAVSAPTGFGGGSMNASFSTTTGMFNTGDIQVNIVANGTGAQDDDDWNLIGNPYPSAIDFSALVNDNTIIEGAYYLWTNCAGLDAQGHHQEAGYAVYASGTGGVQACSTGIIPSGYIATGQGFFVEANSSGTLTFKNSHRVAGNNDNFAGRPAPGHKLWLDLTVLNAAGFSQALIGFVPGATAGKDRLYDARLIGGGSVALYSLTGNDRLSIQGLPPLDSTLISRIPLGVYASQNSSLNIHLNRTEGDWSRWHVYLYDRSGDIYHEITQSDYSFNVQGGFTDDRFELVLVPYQMDVENVSGDSVFIASNDGIFTVKAKKLQSVEVYDMNGRFIMRRDTRSQSEEETVDLTRSARGVYLLVIYFKDGSVLKRKVIR